MAELTPQFGVNIFQKIGLFFVLFQQRNEIGRNHHHEQNYHNSHEEKYKIICEDQLLHVQAPQIDCRLMVVNYFWAKVNRCDTACEVVL